MKKALFTAVFAIIIAISLQASALPPPEVRVLVTSDKSVLIDGYSEKINVLPQGKRPDESFASKGTVRISAGNTGLIMNSIPVGTTAMITNTSRRYRIGDRSFRGSIEAIWKSSDNILIVNHLPIEDYLVGLIGSEVYPTWPMDALKAQAIAARTYALHHADAKKQAAARGDYDVTATVLSQVYEGTHKEDFRAYAACKETEGMALLRNGSIFPAYYHSCCGGITEHAKNVWPGEDGPPQIVDKYCKDSPKMIWNWQIATSRFVEELKKQGIQIGNVLAISTELESDSPRAKMLLMVDEEGMKKIKATELRRIFGFSNIKSTWFDVDIKGSHIVFTGRGYGHGAGMCQWGAKGMADEGFTYEQILKFYYPDAELTRVY
ncbi:MAG: SpoIID/LytB domain-containing protein [Pseudomonadota bacterium]